MEGSASQYLAYLFPINTFNKPGAYRRSKAYKHKQAATARQGVSK